MLRGSADSGLVLSRSAGAGGANGEFERVVSRTRLQFDGTRRAESVSRLRNAVTELARHWVPEDRLDDVALVTSELLTNALQHGADDTDIVTEVVAHDDTFAVEVTNVIAAERPPPMSMWRVASADRSRGRGLGIVHRLASQIDLRSDEKTVTIAVAWPREKR